MPERFPVRFAGLGLPLYLLDPAGVVVCANDRGEAVAPKLVGRPFTSLFDGDEALRAAAMFQRNVRWARHPDYSVDLPSGVRVQISSAALDGAGYAIALFGTGDPDGASLAHVDGLTDRQAEILGLLRGGASTDQIAERLSLSRETVRNHVRHVVERLGVRSRLEAVTL
jgi:DNA-binding CsgD family transcriptional regulator